MPNTGSPSQLSCWYAGAYGMRNGTRTGKPYAGVLGASAPKIARRVPRHLRPQTIERTLLNASDHRSKSVCSQRIEQCVVESAVFIRNCGRCARVVSMRNFFLARPQAGISSRNAVSKQASMTATRFANSCGLLFPHDIAHVVTRSRWPGGSRRRLSRSSRRCDEIAIRCWGRATVGSSNPLSRRTP